jgi:DNA-binding winged helix-turn-helix (wHTH) protein
LRRHGAVVELSPKATAVLAYLLCNRGRTVSREELLRQLWPGVVVSAGSVTQAIWEIRRVLSDSRNARRFIETCHGLGYRFLGVADWVEERAAYVVSPDEASS